MSWVKALPQDALAQDGARQVVKLSNRKVLLLNYQGQFYAVDNRCPHLKGSMKRGKLTEDGGIVCPFHRSVFDLKTGEVKDWCPWPPGIGKALGAIKTGTTLRQSFPPESTKAVFGLTYDSRQLTLEHKHKQGTIP